MSDYRQSAIQLALDLCARASQTPDDQGCLKIIQQRLETVGFDCQSIHFGKVKNLFATIGQKQPDKPSLLLLGHVDVVPSGDLELWNSPPFEPTIRDNCIYARGIADMKGAVASFVVAAEEFLKQHKTLDGQLSIILTSDEEGPAIDGIRRVVNDYFIPNKIQFDYCLVCEPTSEQHPGDTIKIGRRGSLTAKLTLIGKQGHVAYPHNARNPIHLFAPFLSELTQYEWDQGDEYFPATTLQISNIQAGTGVDNVIPELLHVTFNWRYGSARDPKEFQQVIADLLKKHQLDHTISYQNSATPYLSQQNGRLVQACQQAAENIFKQQAVLSTAGGTSDGRFIAPMQVETVEFGPSHQTIHQINEHLPIAELELFPQAYLQIIESTLIQSA